MNDNAPFVANMASLVDGRRLKALLNFLVAGAAVGETVILLTLPLHPHSSTY